MILVSWFKIITFISIIIVATVLSIPNDSKLGIIYFKSYQYDKALQYLTQAKSENKKSPIILKKLKDYFLIQGELEKALFTQKKLTKILPKNIFHWEELARLYNWNNHPYKNLKAKERVASLQDDSTRLKTYLDIFNGYRWLKKEEDARRISQIFYQTNQAKYLEAALDYFLSIQDENQVVRFISKLEKLPKQSRKYKLQLAQAYELNNDYKNAILSYLSVYDPDLKLNKKNINSNFLDRPKKYLQERISLIEKIIFLNQKLNNTKALANIYKKLYEKFPTEYDRALDAAEIYTKSKEFKKAHDILKKIYTVRSASRQYRAANLYLEMNDDKSAIKHLKKAIRLYPFKEIYYEDLTYLYEQQGEKDKALKVQLNLLQMLKNKNGHYFISPNEILFAGKVTTRLPAQKKDIKQTQLKILNLLDEMGNKKEKFKKLIEFHKESPNNYQIKKMLAFEYLSTNQKNKANKLFSELYSQNIYDLEVAIVITDKKIAQGQWIEALKILRPFINVQENWSVKNRLHLIYQKLTPQKAKSLCSSFPSINNFDLIELKVRCLKSSGNLNIAIDYLKKNISNKEIQNKKYLNESLFYLYLENKDFKKAKVLLNNKLKQTLSEDRFVKLKDDYHQTKSEYDKRYSWEHYGQIQSLKFNKIYQVLTFGLLKNFDQFSFGLENQENQVQDLSKDVGRTSLVFNYKIKNHSMVQFLMGKNYGHNSQAPTSVSYQYFPSANFFLSTNISRFNQITQIPGLVTQGSYRHSINAYSEIIIDNKNQINFFLQESIFKTQDNQAKNQEFMLNYRNIFYKNYTVGFFQYRNYVLSGDEFITDKLLNKSQVLAISAGFKKKFSTQYSADINYFFGQDDKRDLSFGDYQRLQAIGSYKLTSDKIFNLSFDWNKESLQVNDNESIAIQLDYRIWFK